MKHANLTEPGPGAKGSGMRRLMADRGFAIIVGSVLAPVMLGGCINVNAPAEPIVIELNINIRQEVIYRLAEDVEDNIDENADIF